MKVAYKLLLGLALIQATAFTGIAYAADEPKIEVIDGKISMSAQAVSLGRLLSMFDRAMGTKSEIKGGLENRNISVQFTDLSFNDAVRKIFQGQPINYVVVQGKGIKVTDLATGGASDFSSSAPASSFSSPSSFNSPVQPIQNNPVQPAPAVSIFGGPAPAAANNNTNPAAPLSGPGVIPPAIGANNPLINPTGGNNTGAGAPTGGAPAPAPQPVGPGMIPGAAPGTIK